jgi:glycosyltransferase involved in cell wall biosynthesis
MEVRFATRNSHDSGRSTPTISIAMVVYNGPRFLPDMLDSLVRQTLPPDELVVCDNCSTDDSRALIEDFACRAPFVGRLHVNDRNLGPNANFERAIALCTKEIIFTADCDEVWFPHKLETVAVHFAESDEVSLVLSDRRGSSDRWLHASTCS